MEHRWSMRKRLSGRARLSCPNGASAQAVIHDLSLGGIGLVTHCALTPGICLRVSFALDNDLDHAAHSLPAVVVHGHGEHAGLVFVDAAPQILRALRIVLCHPADQPSATSQQRHVA